MFSNSLDGTTVRDLVFLVQDCGCDAAAAQAQLLASHEMLIKSAARRHPELPQGLALAREVFIEAIRNFRFVGNHSVATLCWSAMCSALDETASTMTASQQIPLFIEPAVPAGTTDMQLLQRIASLDAVWSLRTRHFGLSA